MSIRNFVPTYWAETLFQELDNAHVLVPLCNREYEGEITNAGDQVKINAIGDVTISNYAPNVTSITAQQLDAQQTILEIDQSKYFAFYIDDVDSAQANQNLMPEAMRKSAYGLSDVSDRFVANKYTDAAVTVRSTATVLANTLSILSNAAKELDQRSVPMQGRWAVVPPWYVQKLVLNKVLQTDGSVVADDAYSNGWVGRVFGFDIYMSNNLTTGSVGTIANQSHFAIAGTRRAISFAEQVVKMEAYRPENSFSDAVKGLHVYGAKVIDPNALVNLTIATAS